MRHPISSPKKNVPMVATESSCELPAPTYAPTEESGTFVLAEGPFAYSEMKRFIREAIDEKFDQFEKGTLKPYCEKMKTAGTENSMENLYEVLQTQLRAVTKDLSDNLCATIRQQLSSGPHYDQPDSKSLDNKPEKGRKDSLKPHKTATKLLESATNHTRSTPTSYSASASGVDGTAAHIHTGTLPDGSYEGLGSEPTSEEVHSKIDHLAGQDKASKRGKEHFAEKT
ncbi:uncharacterized protein [Dysidea avara]|uniref:uncharacterized protein isoform X2 n=1 Tax=Dysidea avara TaxID=196820 RepID=UPI00331E568F